MKVLIKTRVRVQCEPGLVEVSPEEARRLMNLGVCEIVSEKETKKPTKTTRKTK